MWKEKKEIKKIGILEYLKNERGVLDEIKHNFIVFEGLTFGEKIKNLMKSRGHKL